MPKKVPVPGSEPISVSFSADVTLNLGMYENVRIGWAEEWKVAPGQAEATRQKIAEVVISNLDKQCRGFVEDFKILGKDSGQVAQS